MILRQSLIAEFRGPGARRNLEDSGDDYDLKLDHQSKGAGGRSGRIILLGDGSEVFTDSDDTDMYDHEEEDKDLDSQVTKGETAANEEDRGTREETPGPEPQTITEKQSAAGSTLRNPFEPSSDESDHLDPSGTFNTKVIPESALPDKLVTPPIPQEQK